MKVAVKRKKSIWKRLRYDNILALIFVIGFISTFCMWFSSLDNYDVTYVEYRMQENDSLFNVVQDMNKDYMPWGWDAHDLVALAKDKNDICNVAKVQAGKTILIPITSEKE
jgi:hypothetical protein